MPNLKILENIEELKRLSTNISSYNLTVAENREDVYNTSPLPSTWDETTLGTRYNKDGYTVRTSSYDLSGVNTAIKALDNNTSTRWVSNLEWESYISIEFPEPIIIKKMRLMFSSNARETAISIQGSNDNSSWSTLWMMSNGTSITTPTNVTLAPASSYKYYRLRFYNVGERAVAQVQELQISEYSTYSISHTILDTTEGWKSNQIILLKTPTNYNLNLITSNTLNGIPVSTILEPDTYYELMFNGSDFEYIFSISDVLEILGTQDNDITNIAQSITAIRDSITDLQNQIGEILSYAPVGGLPIGTEFYIEESGVLTPYILVQKDYKLTTNVIAIRKNLLYNRVYTMDSNFTYYGQSNPSVDIDTYLVNTYQSTLNVDFAPISINASYRASSSSTTITRSAFLPSLTELTGLGFDSNNNYNYSRIEGSQFTYFANGGSKVSYYNGLPRRYHLRTICNTTSNYHIHSDGVSILNSSFDTLWYVRPCISMLKTNNVYVRTAAPTNVVATAELID